MSREAATIFATAQISSSPCTGHDLPQPGDLAFDAAVAAAPPHAHCRVVVLVAILILA